jgi:RND family efflux transporter MFP subunit
MQPDDPTHRSTETPRETAPSLPRRRPPVLSYVLVALAAALLGVVVTWYAARPRPSGEIEPAPSGGQSQPATSGAHAGHSGPAADPQAGAAGETAVYISPARQQMFGVRTAVVERRQLDTTLRTVGTLAYDETRIAMIHTRVSGWVEDVYVDYVGRPVRRHEPLLTVYSPELVSTQNEYLLALRGRDQLRASTVNAARTATESLLAAALDRLRLWDIPEEQIAELERTGKVQRTLALHSPFDGVVLEREAYPGQYLTPEMPAFKIADLSRIWALGAVFEYELARVRVGQRAEIHFPYGQSNRALVGEITFIYPEVDPQTRRVKVRAEFRNPGLQFKPESFVTMLIRTPGGEHLAVPKEAVIDTGTRRYAILARDGGYFEPREVEVGEPSDEAYPILSGLEEGDRVVTSAQFLVDSETNLQEAMQSMIGMHGGMEMQPETGGETPRPAEPSSAAPRPATPPSVKPPAEHGH